MAPPIPRAPPVITATLPSSEKFGRCMSSSLEPKQAPYPRPPAAARYVAQRRFAAYTRAAFLQIDGIFRAFADGAASP
jgi:hypothetical protein